MVTSTVSSVYMEVIQRAAWGALGVYDFANKVNECVPMYFVERFCDVDLNHV